MELRKLKEEKASLEYRLGEVIRDEISKFTADGGFCPCDIQVIMGEQRAIGSAPEYFVSRVLVNFGL